MFREVTEYERGRVWSLKVQDLDKKGSGGWRNVLKMRHVIGADGERSRTLSYVILLGLFGLPLPSFGPYSPNLPDLWLLSISMNLQDVLCRLKLRATLGSIASLGADYLVQLLRSRVYPHNY